MSDPGQVATSNSSTRGAAGAVAGAAAVAALVAWALSDGTARAGGVPVVVIAALVAFGINWLVYVPSWIARSETYYDLTGSVTYVSTIAVTALLADDLDARAWIVLGMVVVWAARLGSYLFARIRRSGGDSRFDKLKQHPLLFLQAWTLQGLWVFLTLAAALVVVSATERESFGVFAVVGGVVWLAGFSIEVLADGQKRAFAADPSNDGRFITGGLWAWSRHPNYFGEITLWTGVAIMALPVLSGWNFVALVSPVFVAVLLIGVSGIPLLERKADKRWGAEPGYQEYKRNTPVLVPRPPR